MKKLSIIIVNYNVCFFLEQVLLSIKKSSKSVDLEVIIVDNNSADNSVAMVKSKFPSCILIENKINTGFSKANNQGIKIAKGKYVLLLNPDTVVEEDTLEKCCHFMDTHHDAGGLGVMMVDGTGKFLPESKRGLPTPWVAFCKVFGLAALFPKSKKFGSYHLGYLDNNKTHQIEVLSGAFMFLRAETLQKTGLLDEDYFMYGEDIDLSYRVIKQGYKNYYLPETRIIHYKGESTKRSSLNYVFIFYQAMIIFARKHFTSRNATAFSALIHIAIYLRAGISMCIRVAKWLALPAIDASIIFIGMYFLKNYYEQNFKRSNHFTPDFIQIIIPLYILVWITTSYYSGAYDKVVRTSKIVRGVIVGTILISAISNFFDMYRYSKALILVGSIYTILAMVLIRVCIHFAKYRNIALGETNKKKIAILGNNEESQRAISLLNNNPAPIDIIGFICPRHSLVQGENYLGEISRLAEIIHIYNIDELIFCSKDFTAKEIINSMISITNPNIGFKILPDDSNYIIGSNSKNAAGEFYTLNIDLNILQKSARRNKRVFDIGLSLIFLLCSPLLMWFTTHPLQFLKNIWNVLLGDFTFVGFTNTVSVQVPKIKKGIITPISHFGEQAIDASTTDRLNMIYAKNYTVYSDILLIFKSFRFLGM